RDAGCAVPVIHFRAGYASDAGLRTNPSSARYPSHTDNSRTDNKKSRASLPEARDFPYLILGCRLYATLRQHGVGDLHEASDVGSDYVVDVAVGLGAVLHA